MNGAIADWQVFGHELGQAIQPIVTSVGSKLMADFGQILAQGSTPTQKQDGSLVTQSDQWADEHIKTSLLARFPDYGVLTEESAQVLPDREWCWIVDPLDGTTNFARGIPIWGISLGLLHRGVPVFGYVYLPPLQQTFSGWFTAQAQAAYLNGVAIAASQDALSPNHFVSFCSRSLAAVNQARFLFKLRMLGVASYNLLTVATGSTLAAVEATPKIWDIAAAWVITQAAGAQWLPLESEPIFPLQTGKNYRDRNFPTLVVSNSALIPTFQQLAQPLIEIPNSL